MSTIENQSTENNDPILIWKFHWDCKRQGDVDGIFSATKKEVASAIGKNVYFGEILGKHSEIFGTLEENEVVALTDDQDFVKKAIVLGLVPTGYNPLDYLEQND